jgi:hypothetical protein
MNPFKTSLLFSMVTAVSLLATSCVSVDEDRDDDDDDDDHPRRTTTTTTTTHERRVAPASTQETRVIRY